MCSSIVYFGSTHIRNSAIFFARLKAFVHSGDQIVIRRLPLHALCRCRMDSLFGLSVLFRRWIGRTGVPR